MMLYRFIRKHIPGLRLLPLSTDAYVPGSILDHEKMRVIGHCRHVLPDEPASSWDYSLSEASIIYGTISTNRKMNSGIRLLGVLSLRGGAAKELRVNVEVSDIRGASLNISQIELQPKLNQLRQLDRRGRWRQVNNNLVVLESFFASEFKATFYRKSKVLTKVELEDITSIDVQAEVDMQWVSDKSLVVSRNDQLPFGVRGFVV